MRRAGDTIDLMKLLHILCMLSFAVGLAIAQPTIAVVENAASNIPPGLPNGAIAQGALFVVKGSGLGPATFVVASAFPLQTSIAGASVKVAVAGKSVDAIMYYAGATQVAAILPSSTPAGTGTLTVTYNNQPSASAPITVVQNNIGIFTVSQSGSGDAIATLGAGFVSPTNAANPGETVALWGTGLGPVTFDESNAAQQSDMAGNPIEAYVAGKPATVLFRGRNGCCSAVDTVYIQIPQGSVTGCSTPVVFKIGNMVSNTTTIPTSASGRTCTPTSPSFSQSDLNKWAAKGSLNIGGISLIRTTTTTLPITVGGFTVPGNTTKADSGGATFYKVPVVSGGLGLSSIVDIATYGSCTVSFYSGQTTPPATFTSQSLDAGPSIGVLGPNGQKTLAKTTAGGFSSYYASFDQSATYLNAGTYTISGSGGADVGAFSVGMTLPAPLTWTNQSSITTVNRASGVTVNWSGGDPAGYVTISGASFAGSSASNAVTAAFTCIAKTSDQTFTVPPVVLLSLPPSGTQSSGGVTIALPGTLSVGGSSVSVNFTAPGLDFGGAGSIVIASSGVTYQ